MSKYKANVFHITHNDGDAVGCDLVLRAVSGPIHTFWCKPNTVDGIVMELLEQWKSDDYPKEELPDIIVISDISVKISTWNEITRFKTKHEFQLIMIDHHPTNPCKHESCVTVKTHNIDGVPISAAKLMFNYYYNTIHNTLTQWQEDVLYIIIEDISRYDTWEWKRYPRGCFPPESLVSDICKLIGPDETVDMLLTHLQSISAPGSDTIYPQFFITLCNAIEIKKKNSIEHVENFVKITTEGEYIYASFIASSEFTNEIAEYVYENYDVDIVRVLYPSSCKIGYRTKRDDINVGRLAQRLYGGGGHPKASGATLSLEDFVFIYMKVMNAPAIKDSEFKK